MAHHHTDHEHHDHQHTELIEPNRIFKIGISLNLLFVCIEVYFGIIHKSLALISDGIHNLTDVFGLFIAWIGYYFSKKLAAKKFSVYAAFINTSLIIITSVWLIFEAYKRLYSGQSPVALTMIFVALIGFIINFFTAKLFHKNHHHDLNMKAAYLHLMADAAISLGVVITGIIIYYKAILWIDPIVSAIISAIIIFTTWGYLKQSWMMLSGKTILK